jgi:fatty acid desaturase
LLNLPKQRRFWSLYGQLIEDTKTVLNSLQQWYVGHIKREANEVAHRLTKALVNQSLEQVWMKDDPIFGHAIVLVVQGVSFPSYSSSFFFFFFFVTN